MTTLQERVANALAAILNPRTGTDLVSSEMVRDIAVTTGGKVRLTMLLYAGEDATLVRAARKSLELVEGVTEVRIDVKDSSEARQTSRAEPKPVGRALPVMDTRPALAPRPHAPTPIAYPNL